MKEDQPAPDQVNGSTKPPKVSPSEKAYIEAAGKIVAASSVLVGRELGETAPDELVRMLTFLISSARQREADMYALLDVIVEAKLATRDQFKDRAAAHAERYAQQLMAQEQKPAIFVPKRN